MMNGKNGTNATTPPLDEPLRFERHFVEKVWGGRSLERVPGFALPAGMRVGETWEVVDRERENSVVAVGAQRGRTLGELMERHGREILGSAAPNREGRFPLLVKYLDAAQELSVQVHPDEDGARSLGPPAEAKTEAWYVIDADPDARLYAGLAEGVDREAFHAALEASGPSAVVQDSGDAPLLATLERWPARRGDALLVRGGTVHAIGAGVRILEVQQNSDTTLRLWDWGRLGLDGEPRPTQVPEALRCIGFGERAPGPRAPRWEAAEAGLERAELAASHAFHMEGLRLAASARRNTAGAFRLYAVVRGTGALELAAGRWPLATGEVWLLPAGVGEHALVSAPGGLELVSIGPGR